MAQALRTKLAKYATTKIKADTAALNTNQKTALKKLVTAAKVINELYMQQLWSDNLSLYNKLKEDTSEEGSLLSRYYWINRGPWNVLEDHEAFTSSVPKKPKGANFYPLDMSKEEFEAWIKGMTAKEKENATGYFHLITRASEDKKLKATPYSEAYKTQLTQVSSLLSEAASLVENDSLRKFLTSRASSFLSNDYYDSDVAWMKIDDSSAIDVTIGPYEVYEDELFNYKAAFEAFIALRDFDESKKLKKFTNELQAIENDLPLPDKYKNTKISERYIVVVNQVYSAGDVAGPMTAAFCLPNDERVCKQEGTKLVLLKNVQEEKFKQVLTPIAKKVIRADQQQYISFDAFFTHILSHECSHSLGPHDIVVDGKKTTVRAQMKEIHSAIEEGKADILGLHALLHFMDKGIVSKDMKNSFYVTYLAGAFRSIRFGLEEAHGKGQALQLNYLLDKGGFGYDKEDKTFFVNFDKIGQAVKDLTGEILLAQAKGCKATAQKLLDTYAIKTDIMAEALNSLEDIPVDLEPIYEGEIFQ